MILKHLDKLPPAVCRLLACCSNGWEPMSHRELAERCGLPKTKVADISQRTTWVGVPVGVMQKFAEGCQVDLLHPSADLYRFRKNAKPYMKRATKAQRLFYQKLMNRLLADRDKARMG